LETKGKEFFKLIYPTETIYIEPDSQHIGFCDDGGFNSIVIHYDNLDNVVPKFTDDFFTIETNGWLVEKCSITNVCIEYETINNKSLDVKLLIHFHSRMIRGDQMDKVKKNINRRDRIKNILKK
jgi:hypothetical protein